MSNNKSIKDCPACGGNSFYSLSDHRIMCSQCKKKITPDIKPFRIGKKMQEQILALFMDNISAAGAARQTGINRKTVQRYYRFIRKEIAEKLETVEDNYLFGKEENIDSSNDYSFCITFFDNRFHIVSLTKAKLATADKLPIFFYILKSSDVSDIYIKKGDTEPTESALKFKQFFLNTLKDKTLSSHTNFYYQLKEIEYRFNKFIIGDCSISLEGIN